MSTNESIQENVQEGVKISAGPPGMVVTIPIGKDVESESYYDFNTERLPIMILSGYVILKKPILYRLLTSLHFAFVCSIHSYHVVLSFYTIMLFSGNKDIVVPCFLLLILLFFTITLIGIRLFTDQSLNVVRDLLKKGVFKYEADANFVEYRLIKEKRIKHIRTFLAYFTKYCYFTSLSNIFFIPLLQFLTIAEDATQFPINPFLPLPIYVPFNTNTKYGYGVAFLLEGIFLICSFSAYICHEELYLSLSFQICAQLETLNYSINNLESRACLKFQKTNLDFKPTDTLSRLYERPGFQKCLYFCLRENILHHQAIIRFLEATAPYLETTNFIVLIGFSLLMATELLLVLENPGLNLAVMLTMISDFIGILQIMYVGQMVEDESAKTMTSFYSTPWILCDKRFKTLLSMSITKSQEPLYLRTKFFRVRTKLSTFADIISVGYKMLNVFR